MYLYLYAQNKNKEPIICWGVNEYYGKPMVDNELSTCKGFTVKTLLHRHRVNKPAKGDHIHNVFNIMS